MTYRVELTPAATRALRKLPREVLKRIDTAILKLSHDPRPHGAVRIVGETDTYRIRVGAYRILYDVSDASLLIVVIRLGHRRDIYKKR